MQAELIPVIGTVGYALRPILINNRIHNVPETLPFAFETLLRANGHRPSGSSANRFSTTFSYRLVPFGTH